MNRTEQITCRCILRNRDLNAVLMYFQAIGFHCETDFITISPGGWQAYLCCSLNLARQTKARAREREAGDVGEQRDEH